MKAGEANVLKTLTVQSFRDKIFATRSHTASTVMRSLTNILNWSKDIAVNNNITLIYGLINPIDGKFFYVGRTSTTLCKRLRAHLKESKTAQNPKCKKIASIVANGAIPEIIELAQLHKPTLGEAEVCEQAWIDFLGFSYQLTNIKPAAAGGIGNGDGVRYKWTPEILDRLGKESDSAIALHLGCSQTAVADQRIKLRIPKYTELKWQADVLARLGNESDSIIAQDLKIAQSAVRTKRVSLGIPTYKPVVWTPEAIAMLGKVADKVIALTLGCKPSTVSWRRQKLGIKPCRKRTEKYKRETPPPNKTILPDWVIKKLGTITDALLAEESGYTHRVINSARIRLGIPSYAESMKFPTQFKQGMPHPRWER